MDTHNALGNTVIDIYRLRRKNQRHLPDLENKYSTITAIDRWWQYVRTRIAIDCGIHVSLWITIVDLSTTIPASSREALEIRQKHT